MERDPNETTNLLHGDVSKTTLEFRKVMREKLLEYEREWGLEGYVGKSDFKIGEAYQPHPQRNEAFQRFILKITDEREREQMNKLVGEIPRAVAKEPIVNLRELDLSAWQSNLRISDRDLKQMLADHDRLRLE